MAQVESQTFSLKKSTVPNWKAFKCDTQAGKLLSRLYGVQPESRPKINYPVLKAKKQRNEECIVEHVSQWRNVNAKPGSTDPREVKFQKDKAKALSVPKVGRAQPIQSKNNVSRPINLSRQVFPSRKTEVACRKEIRNIAMKNEAYRPPHERSISTDYEKNRLNEIFIFKGGQALPLELTNPIQPIPSENEITLEQSQSNKVQAQRRDRLAKWRIKHDTKSVETLTTKEEEKNIDSLVVEQIEKEIKERLSFQMEMEESGAGNSSRNRIDHEIMTRMIELKRLNPQKAEELEKLRIKLSK